MYRLMPIEFIKKNWEKFLLGLLCLILLVSHALYVITTYQYPKWDEHHYLNHAFALYDILKNPTFGNLSQILTITAGRQPLYGFSIGIPVLLFGPFYVYKIGLALNYAYYAVSVVGIYFLGRRFMSKLGSLLASWMFAFYGFPLFYLHFTYSETAATTFVVLSLLFLARSNNFTQRKEVIYFSFFFAASLLTRWATPIFIIGQFIFVLGMLLFEIKRVNISITQSFKNI